MQLGPSKVVRVSNGLGLRLEIMRFCVWDVRMGDTVCVGGKY